MVTLGGGAVRGGRGEGEGGGRGKGRERERGGEGKGGRGGGGSKRQKYLQTTLSERGIEGVRKGGGEWRKRGRMWKRMVGE